MKLSRIVPCLTVGWILVFMTACGDNDNAENVNLPSSIGSKSAQAPKSNQSKADAQPLPPESEWIQSGPFRMATLEHDFGEIRDTEKVAFSYPFVNATDRTVRILDLKQGCKCATWELDQQEYAPGEAGVVAMTFNAKGRGGADSQRLTIVTDFSDRPNVDIALRAFVVARVAIQPTVVSFVKLSPGVIPPPKELKIVSRNLDIEILDATLEDPRFSFEVLGSERGTDHGDDVVIFKYRVGFAGQQEIEQVQTSVQFRTNDFEKGNFAVPVIATIVGPIMVTPHRVLLQGQKRSEPFTKQIQLGPREEGFGFNLTALELVDVPPELGLSVEMLPPNDARPGWVVLSLKGYAPSSPTGPDGFVVRGAVLVRTDAAAQPELRIPLEGTFVLP